MGKNAPEIASGADCIPVLATYFICWIWQCDSSPNPGRETFSEAFCPRYRASRGILEAILFRETPVLRDAITAYQTGPSVSRSMVLWTPDAISCLPDGSITWQRSRCKHCRSLPLVPRCGIVVYANWEGHPLQCSITRLLTINLTNVTCLPTRALPIAPR